MMFSGFFSVCRFMRCIGHKSSVVEDDLPELLRGVFFLHVLTCLWFFVRRLAGFAFGCHVALSTHTASLAQAATGRAWRASQCRQGPLQVCT